MGELTVQEWLLGVFLIGSALGVILAKNPILSLLSFLFSLFVLAVTYFQLAAQFIAVMQILVYGGAILVIFCFVMILFQDAEKEIRKVKEKSRGPFLLFAGLAFFLALFFLAQNVGGLKPLSRNLPEDFGMAEGVGRAIYIDFFFPFEAVIVLFLVALIGAFYMGKKRVE